MAENVNMTKEQQEMLAAAKAAGVTPSPEPNIVDTARLQMQQSRLKSSVKDLLNDPSIPSSGIVVPPTAVNLFNPGKGAPPLITPKDQYVFPFDGHLEERTMKNRLREISKGNPDPLTPGVVDKTASYLGNKAVGAATQASTAIGSVGAAATKPIYNAGVDLAPKAADAIKPIVEPMGRALKSYTGELADSWGIPKVAQPTASSDSSGYTMSPRLNVDYSDPSYRPVYNPQEAAQQALAKGDSFVQRQLQMAYDRASGMTDPTARANYLAQATAGLREAQGSLVQHAQARAAKLAGLVAQGSDGRDKTMAGVPHAGDMIDGSGKVTATPEMGAGERGFDTKGRPAMVFHPQPGVTVYQPLSQQATPGKADTRALAKQALDDKLTNGIIRNQDLAIAKGVDMNGIRINDEEIETAPERLREPDMVALNAINNGTYSPGTRGTINGVPGDKYLENNSRQMYQQGIVDPNSPAGKINQQISQRIREGKDFGDLLLELDKASGQPGFNRSLVSKEGNPDDVSKPDGTVVNSNSGVVSTNGFVDPYAGRKIDPRSFAENGQQSLTPTTFTGPVAQAPDLKKALSLEEALIPGSSTNPAIGMTSPRSYDLPSPQEQEKAVQQRMAENAARTAPLRASEATRWGNYNADRAMEQAMAPRPNGDPIHDAGIASRIASAAQLKAKANGGNPEDYLPKVDGFNATNNTRRIKDLAMDALHGVGGPALINQAVTLNSDNTRFNRSQNQSALKQAAEQEGIQYKGDMDQMKSENASTKSEAAAWKQQALEKKMEDSPKFQQAKALDAEIGRLTSRETELLKLPTLVGEQETALRQTQKKIRELQIRSAKLRGFDNPSEIYGSDVVDTGEQAVDNTPLPPKDKLEVGEVYNTLRGKAKWDGKQFVKI